MSRLAVTNSKFAEDSPELHRARTTDEEARPEATLRPRFAR